MWLLLNITCEQRKYIMWIVEQIDSIASFPAGVTSEAIVAFPALNGAVWSNGILSSVTGNGTYDDQLLDLWPFTFGKAGLQNERAIKRT